MGLTPTKAQVFWYCISVKKLIKLISLVQEMLQEYDVQVFPF